MIATVSPRPIPSLASPPATSSTRRSSSDHVSETLSSAVRTATIPGWPAAVRRRASLTVGASTARPIAGEIVLLSMPSPLQPGFRDALGANAISGGRGSGYARRPRSAQVYAGTGQRRDVVGEPDHEDHQDQHEPDHAGALHDLERD